VIGQFFILTASSILLTAHCRPPYDAKHLIDQSEERILQIDQSKNASKHWPRRVDQCVPKLIGKGMSIFPSTIIFSRYSFGLRCVDRPEGRYHLDAIYLTIGFMTIKRGPVSTPSFCV